MTVDDFFSAALANPGVTNSFGTLVTEANVERISGQNTLGVSLYSGGFIRPHTHPRATEIVFVLYGELEVGFINTANVLYTKIIKNGVIFVFPTGLVYFQRKKGGIPASKNSVHRHHVVRGFAACA